MKNTPDPKLTEVPNWPAVPHLRRNVALLLSEMAEAIEDQEKRLKALEGAQQPTGTSGAKRRSKRGAGKDG